MKVALLEFIDEAKIVLDEFSQGNLDKSNTLIISLNPNVRAFLKRKGVSSKSTLDYFDSYAHARALEKSEDLICLLEDNVEIMDSVGIKEVYKNSFVLYTRFIIAYYLQMIEILDNAFSRHNFDEIIAFTSDNFPCQHPYLQESERYLGIIAVRYANKHNIELRKIDIQTNFNIATDNGGWFERLLTIPIVWNYLLVMRMHRNRKSVLVGDFSYNMDLLIEDTKKAAPGICWILLRMRRKNILKEFIASVIWFILSIIKKPMNMSSHKTSLHYAVPLFFFRKYFQSKKRNLHKNDTMQISEGSIKNIFSKYSDDFSYKGVNFDDLLLDKINVGIFSFIKELEKDTAILYSLMKKINPDFIISPVARDVYFSLGELARVLGIPSLLISHASHIKPKNRLEEIEHDHLGRGLINTEYSLVAIQSPHAKDYAQHFNIKSKVINTGPLLWGRTSRIRKEIYEKLIGPYDKNTKILLHAGTPKTRTGMRFHIYETLDEYIDGIKDIIEAIETIDNVLLVVQFRPWKGLSIEDLKVCLPKSDKVIFSVNTPFRDIISLADVLVSFSSTTIEEALYNKIPVLLYGGNGRYMHMPAFRIDDCASAKRYACYHISNKELLRNGIDWILREHALKKLTEQDLKGYVFEEENRQSIKDFLFSGDFVKVDRLEGGLRA